MHRPAFAPTAALRPVRRLTARPSTTPDAAEARLSGWYAAFSDSPERLRHFLLRHPLGSARAVADTLLLPVLDVRPSALPEGEALRGALTRRAGGLLSVALVGACVVQVPEDPHQYSVGASRQTLRRKARAARSAGVSTRLVTDTRERHELADRLDTALRAKTDERYRSEGLADHLLASSLWMVAVDAQGEPLVLAVTPVDGAWALLQCFVSLGTSRAHSDARYLLTQQLVEQLSVSGVCHLVDSRAAVELTSGLRHFQRMLGFRIARIRVHPAAPARPQGATQPPLRDDARVPGRAAGHAA